MTPLQSGIPIPYHAQPTNTAEAQEASSSQVQHPHPSTLSFSGLSSNAQLALKQVADQPNGHHKFMAQLVLNGIGDGALRIRVPQDKGADVHYDREVTSRDQLAAHLTVCTRLNDQARYDIASIGLHVPSSGETHSITLFAPPPAIPNDEAASATSTQTSSTTRKLSENYTESQLRAALIRQRNPQDFSGPPLPSGVSSNTQSMVFSPSSPAASD